MQKIGTIGSQEAAAPATPLFTCNFTVKITFNLGIPYTVNYIEDTALYNRVLQAK